MQTNCTRRSIWKAAGLITVWGLVIAAAIVVGAQSAEAVDIIINGLPYKLDQGGLRFGADGSITINMSNQTYTGKIGGKVDVPGAEVFLKSPAIDTGVAKYTKVDRFGNFLFDNLPDGTFDVQPVLDGYTFTHPVAQKDTHDIVGGSTISDLIFNGTSNSGGNPPPTAPTAPSGLSCTAISTTQINLGWTDNSNDETQFRIYISATSTKPASPTQTIGANVTSYNATGLTQSTTYYYWVDAYNAYGASSAVSCNATTLAPGGNPPAAPSQLSCSSASTSQINLSWTDNSADETIFRIYRNTASSKPASASYSVNANTTSYSSASLSAGTTYYYWVEAYNSYGPSSAISCSAATQPNTGPGTGNTPSDPKVITIGTPIMSETLNAGASKYYKFTLNSALQATTIGMASINQSSSADCNMLVSTTSADIDTTYATVLGLYQRSGAWGGVYTTGSPATSMARFSHATSGESIVTQKPYAGTIYYIKIKNEGTTQERYNISVSQQ